MKKLFKALTAITKTQTLKDTLIVGFGMGLSTLFSALSIFVIARLLGPGNFGLYTTAFSLVVIVIDAFDLAINSAIVKFAAQIKSTASALVKYGFSLKIYLGLILTVLFILIGQPLASWLHPDLKTPLLIASFFILTTFLFRFPKALLQAQKNFLKDTIAEVTLSFSRLAFVGLFYWFFKLTVVSSLTAYLLSALIAFLVGSGFISWQFLKSKVTSQTKTTFFHFQKWLTIGFIVAAIHSRIDSAILLKLAGAATTGIYQAGYRFFIPALQLSSILSLVFAPRFASFSDYQTTKTYLIKAAKLSLGLASLVLLIIPLASFFINLFFGIEYRPAILPTQILSLGFAFFIAGSPFTSHLIYATGRTKAFFSINLLQLSLILLLDLTLIPLYGAVGAALATTLTFIIINSLLAVLALSYQPA